MALKATALPAVSMVSAIAAVTTARSPGCRAASLERGAEADDDEERVVDAESEGEHQSEVECPDRHRK